MLHTHIGTFSTIRSARWTSWKTRILISPSKCDTRCAAYSMHFLARKDTRRINPSLAFSLVRTGMSDGSSGSVPDLIAFSRHSNENSYSDDERSVSRVISWSSQLCIIRVNKRKDSRKVTVRDKHRFGQGSDNKVALSFSIIGKRCSSNERISMPEREREKERGYFHRHV